MLLIEKIVKYISQLNEKLENIEKDKISKNVKKFLVILEDLHNILNESTYKGDLSEIQLHSDENEHEDGVFYVEDSIDSNLKYELDKEIEKCKEACDQIFEKYTANAFKKTWHYIKVVLFDNPEEVLCEKNILLLQVILNIRLDLKEKKFAILYEDISQVRAQQSIPKKNKKISKYDNLIGNYKEQKMNTLYTLKNKLNQSGGDIIDERSSENNQLSFETPLPPDAYSQFKQLGQVLKQNGDSNNLFSNQKRRNNIDSKKCQEKQDFPQAIKYRLEPQNHPNIQQHDQNHIQEIAICKTINFDDVLTQDSISSFKDFYSFKRSQYADLLSDKIQDLGRISRNHANLKISYYLVNTSPNGCSLLRDGLKEWIKMKEVGQEQEINHNDTVGILFDSVTQELMIGYKFQIIQ